MTLLEEEEVLVPADPVLAKESRRRRWRKEELKTKRHIFKAGSVWDSWIIVSTTVTANIY